MIEVFHGPIALALQLDVAGAAGPARPADGDFQPPMPQAWLDAVKGEARPMIVPDDFLALVWPDDPGRRGTERPAPQGFVNQTLEPWGGLMFRPEAWFYTEGHQGPRFMWTLAKEDPASGSYTTGVRVQAVLGVKKHTRQTAEAFIQSFIDKKRKSAARVIKDCGAGSEQRGMTRLCLETEEGPHHIHYSLFFNNDADLAVVMTSGTTKELWPQYTAIFDTMREFQLLDMKHMEAQLAKPK